MINASSLRQCCGDSKRAYTQKRGEFSASHPETFNPFLALENSPQQINLNRSSFGFGVGSSSPAPLFFRMPLRGKSMKYPSETARRHFKTENEALLWMDLRKYPAYIMLNTPPFYFFTMTSPHFFVELMC